MKRSLRIRKNAISVNVFFSLFRAYLFELNFKLEFKHRRMIQLKHLKYAMLLFPCPQVSAQKKSLIFKA